MLCYCKQGIKFVRTPEDVIDASKNFSGFIFVQEGNFLVKVTDGKIPDDFMQVVIAYRRKKNGLLYPDGILLITENLDDIPKLDSSINGYLYVTSTKTLIKIRNGQLPDSIQKQNVTDITLQPTVMDIFNDGSCIAFYRFDGNANDDGGRYNGTWYGHEQYDTGLHGLAAKFDGNSYIETSFIPQIPMSFSVWFKLDSLPPKNESYYTIFCAKYGNDTGNDWIIAVGRDDTGTYLFFNGGWTDTYAYIPIKPNRWYHYALVVPDDNITNTKFYLNTIQVQSYVKYNDYRLHSDKLQGSIIGKGFINLGSIYERGAFKGLIDQFRIFNRVLSSQEVLQIYNYERK